MSHSKCISLIVIIQLIFVFRLTAQPTNIKFDQIGLEQGLSQSTVNAIVQDAQGFIWFGTQDGLNRYDGYSIKVFKHNPNDANSISDNTIWSLLNDSKGDLWIGTMRGGVNKYVLSENRFYSYKHIDGDSTTISENFITFFFEDTDGDIWIGTRNQGLNHFNRATDSFTRFLFDEKDTLSLSSNTVWTICEDLNKNLWIGTSRGLCKLNINKKTEALRKPRFVRYTNNPNDKTSLSSNNIRALNIDKDGLLWIGTWGSGLNIFKTETNSFKRYLFGGKTSPSITSNFITSIHKDSKGNQWIATYDAGLMLYDHQIDYFFSYSSYAMGTMYEDKSGILWIGTYTSGVKIYDQRKNYFKHYYNNPNDKKGNVVLSILMDRDGELWVGTYDNGLYRYNDKRRRIAAYTFDAKNPHSLGGNKILSLCESRQNNDSNIWVGTEVGGLSRLDKKTGNIVRYKHNSNEYNSVSSNQISAMYNDNENNVLWIGYLSGGMSNFNLTTGKFKHFKEDENNLKTLPRKAVTIIYKGKISGLWIGTFQGGLYRYVSDSSFADETGWFKRYDDTSETYSSVNKNIIASIYEDDAGIIWIGTYGGGLNKYNPSSNIFTYYTTEQGLPNDVVYGIIPDKTGNLWLSTNKGLSRFNPKTETFRNFDVSDGLQANEFNQGAYFASPTGELFFGGINGFNSFFPDDIKDNNYVPPVYLTTFKVFNEVLPLANPIPIDSRIELSYSQNFFSFEFVALNYTSPGKNQYAYMLEGFDDGWHNVSSQQRYASYTNLDPGEYILRVKGSNNHGVWNEDGTAVSIVIHPPFWMTWWFKSLGIITFLSFAFVIYQRKKIAQKKEKELQKEISRRLMEKQEEERSRIAGDLHDSLGQNLLVIKNRALLGLQKIKSSEDLLEDLTEISETASTAIKEVRQISHHLRPYELDRFGLTEALRSVVEKVESSSKIIFIKEIDDIDNLLRKDSEINVYRIIQECLNNIVKHSAASNAEVNIKKNQNSVQIIVRDKGKGFDPVLIKQSNQRGSGLDSLDEKIRIIGGKWSIDSMPGSGTKIMIMIPFSQKENEK